jgi:HPt (histidine-containing phosphotransfer) domain-containing protein
LRCVLADLCGDVSQRLAELQAAIARGDALVARREVHTLKGLAATGGNMVLRQAALEVQELCESDDLAGAAQRLPALEHMLGEALAAWQNYLRT